jgi:hypothetical protein
MFRWAASELGLPVTLTPVDMARKKHPKPGERLTRLVGVRLSEEHYEKFKAMLHSTNCQNVSELIRRIVLKDKIYFYYVDGTLDIPVEELCTLRRDINCIGININQVTAEFHKAESPAGKLAAALRIESQYREVGKLEQRLLDMISEFTKKCFNKDYLREGYRLGEFKVLRVPQKPAKN